MSDHDDVFVAGTVENQSRFRDRFDHVVLLSAPLSVLIERVNNRTTNPYGKTPEQQAEIRRYISTVEPLLREHPSNSMDNVQYPNSPIYWKRSRHERTDMPRRARSCRIADVRLDSVNGVLLLGA